MELFAKIVYYIQPLTIFAKHFILFVLQGYEYASDKVKQKPGVLPFISQNIRTEISANLFFNSILSSHYYLTVRHQSQIQYTCLSFQIYSPLHLNTYNINQPLFICSSSSQLLLISLVKVKKCKANYTVLFY